jgi:hypothetical protein
MALSFLYIAFVRILQLLHQWHCRRSWEACLRRPVDADDQAAVSARRAALDPQD